MMKFMYFYFKNKISRYIDNLINFNEGVLNNIYINIFIIYYVWELVDGFVSSCMDDIIYFF